MERCYIFKDGIQQASTATRESALELIREYQKLETHPHPAGGVQHYHGGGGNHTLPAPEETAETDVRDGTIGGEKFGSKNKPGNP